MFVWVWERERNREEKKAKERSELTASYLKGEMHGVSPYFKNIAILNQIHENGKIWKK